MTLTRSEPVCGDEHSNHEISQDDEQKSEKLGLGGCSVKLVARNEQENSGKLTCISQYIIIQYNTISIIEDKFWETYSLITVTMTMAACYWLTQHSILRLRIWERADTMMIKLAPLSAKLAKLPPSCNGFHILGKQLAVPRHSRVYMLILSIYLSVCLPVCLSVFLMSIYAFMIIYLSIISINLSIYLHVSAPSVGHQSNMQVMRSLYHQARCLKNPEPEAYPPGGRKHITTLQNSKTAWAAWIV